MFTVLTEKWANVKKGSEYMSILVMFWLKEGRKKEGKGGREDEKEELGWEQGRRLLISMCCHGNSIPLLPRQQQ